MWHTIHTRVRALNHHRVFKHSHHLTYCIYYGLAVAGERGLHQIIGGVVLLIAVVTAIAGEE